MELVKKSNNKNTMFKRLLKRLEEWLVRRRVRKDWLSKLDAAIQAERGNSRPLEWEFAGGKWKSNTNIDFNDKA